MTHYHCRGAAIAQREIRLKKASTHRIAIVKKFKPKGDEKKGYIYYIIIATGDIIHYQCDIENAIAAGEVIVPDEYKYKKFSQSISVADEIAKLKNYMTTAL